MASGEGISGLAVAVATAGAVLIYAGYRDVNPLQALRDVSSGKPPPVESTSAGLDDNPATIGDSMLDWGQEVVGDLTVGKAIVAAAYQYKNDKYNQSMRHSPGYSDCSSFVAKALKKVGIKPPNPDTTQGFVKSSKWKTIPLSDAKAGDIVVTKSLFPGTGHMVLVTGPGKAIGQQRPGRNVQEGSIKSLMSGHDNYIARRYVGKVG